RVLLMELLHIAATLVGNSQSSPNELVVVNASTLEIRFLVGQVPEIQGLRADIRGPVSRLIGPREKQRDIGGLAFNGRVPLPIEQVADAVSGGLDDPERAVDIRKSLREPEPGRVRVRGPESDLGCVDAMIGARTERIGRAGSSDV